MERRVFFLHVVSEESLMKVDALPDDREIARQLAGPPELRESRREAQSRSPRPTPWMTDVEVVRELEFGRR